MENKKLSRMEYGVTQLGETEPPFSHPGFPSERENFSVFAVQVNYFLHARSLKVVQDGLASVVPYQRKL